MGKDLQMYAHIAHEITNFCKIQHLGLHFLKFKIVQSTFEIFLDLQAPDWEFTWTSKAPDAEEWKLHEIILKVFDGGMTNKRVRHRIKEMPCYEKLVDHFGVPECERVDLSEIQTSCKFSNIFKL